MADVTPDIPSEPYVGLRAYGIDDADWFFGRARESWELTSLVLSSRLVIVYGPPGSGKTSLLGAGVLARLGAETAHVLPIAPLPRASTLAVRASGSTANPFVEAVLHTWAPDEPADRLTIPDLLGSVHVEPDPYGELTRPLVAVIDQLDEVFSAGPDWAEARDELFEQLGRAVDRIPHLRLVLSMHQDVVGDLLSYETRLARGNRRRYQVEPLGRDDALDAVTRPMTAAGRAFAPGAAETLVDRLATTTITDEMGERRTLTTSTIEPTNLQIVCLALWRTLPDDVVTVTTGHLSDHGDVDAILTSFCLRAVIDVAAAERLPEDTLWGWLESTFITDLGTRGTAYEGIASTGAMPNGVARAFEKHRILRAEKRAAAVWFELMHDVLIEPIRRGRMLQDPIALGNAKVFLGRLVAERGRAGSGASADELYDVAERHYRQAAELFDTAQNSVAVGRVLAALGRLLIERGRYADAVGELRGALDRLAGDPAVRLDFARALNLQGLSRAAVGAYTVVLAHAPIEARDERIEALLGRGIITAEHDDAAAALRDLDHAIELRPDLADRPDVAEARDRAIGRLPLGR